MAVWDALQIAEKRKDMKGKKERREVKSKGEKDRYKHLNAEFQRIARRGKKAFLSDQCKEIEENNRMGKTREMGNGEKKKKREREMGKTSRKLEIPREHFMQRWAR